MWGYWKVCWPKKALVLTLPARGNSCIRTRHKDKYNHPFSVYMFLQMIVLS
jgi:hypothetical protein